MNKEGLIDPELIRRNIKKETIGVSVIFVHNEISAIQDIQKIGEICRENKVFFHTDAAQGFGKIPLDVEKMKIDMLSISGHKIYGPKGIGALYVRRKRPRVKLIPLISGGGQERGLRSGTLPTYLCVGLGKASEIAENEMELDYAHVKSLSDYFVSELEKTPKVYFNGSKSKGYPGNINFSIEFIEGESVIMAMKNVALSSGSACTSASLEPSYVLRAIDINEDLAHSSLRFGFGRFTTK